MWIRFPARITAMLDRILVSGSPITAMIPRCIGQQRSLLFTVGDSLSLLHLGGLELSSSYSRVSLVTHRTIVKLSRFCWVLALLCLALLPGFLRFRGIVSHSRLFLPTHQLKDAIYCVSTTRHSHEQIVLYYTNFLDTEGVLTKSKFATERRFY